MRVEYKKQQQKESTTGLKYFWSFDGDSCDAMSGGEMFNGLNGGFSTDRFDKPNAAISFNSGYIKIPNISFDGSDGFTIMFWLNPSSTSNFFLIELATSQFQKDAIRLRSNSIGLFASSSSGVWCLNVYSIINPTLNTWQHLAYTFINPNGSIYKDGLIIGSATATCSLNNTAIRTRNHMGTYTFDINGATNGYVSGKYDELKIFTRGMTQAEILIEINKTTTIDSPLDTTTAITKDKIHDITVLVKCRFEQFCAMNSNMVGSISFYKINPSSDLVIDALLTKNGLSMNTNNMLIYSFGIFFSSNANTSDSWTQLTNTLNLVDGMQSNELVLKASLFQSYSSRQYWRVDLNVSEQTSNQTMTPLWLKSNSTYFQINQAPRNGICMTDKLNGTALDTFFNISCSNWIDLDGTIEKYEFYFNHSGLIEPILVGFNSKGSILAQLPNGPEYDSFKLSLFVRIIDDYEASTQFNIPTSLHVQPNSNIENVFSSTSPLLNQIQSGSIDQASTNVILISNAIAQSNSTQIGSILDSMIQSFTQNALNRIDSINDISDIKIISGALSQATNQYTQISQNSMSDSMKLTTALCSKLSHISDKLNFKDLKEASSNIYSSMANSFTGISIDSSANKSSETQKEDFFQKTVKMAKRTKENTEILRNILEDRLTLNATLEVGNDAMKMILQKSYMTNVEENHELNKGKISLGQSSCSLISTSGNLNDCKSTVVFQQTDQSKMAMQGFNGDQMKLGESSQIGYTLYDKNKKQLSISSLKTPIKFIIERSNIQDQALFRLINATKMNETNSNFVSHVFASTNPNVSIHVHLKAANNTTQVNIGYLMTLKYGQVKADLLTFDHWKLFCSNKDLRFDGIESYFQLFQNMNQTKTKSSIGSLLISLAIRELNSLEFTEYCLSNKSNITIQSLSVSKANKSMKTADYFTSDYYLRIVTSGCYYLNETSYTWSSDGVEILEESNSTHTICNAYHLTSFAGGFVVLPDEINFDQVWAQASFTQNPTVYATVIALVSLYLILAIVCVYFDRRDEKKMGFTLLRKDFDSLANLKDVYYYYEIIIFTGLSLGSGTTSKVSCIISSDKTETKVIELKDSKRKVFNRGGVDSFIYASKKPLGELMSIIIWHDGSGSSWYLKHIIVHDLQTRDKDYFICERWLALDKDDGQLMRPVSVCGRKQKSQFKYLFKKQAEQNLSDNHLWFSILARPIQSSFSRIDRLTCCFVLLCISMMVNILYYGIGKSSAPDGLKLGPFLITPEQIGVGIISNLIIFPPSFLLVQLFRRSKSRKTRQSVLKDKLDELERNNKSANYEKKSIEDVNKVGADKNEKSKSNKNTKNQKKFPWWFKIIAYILAFCFAGISIFFIIVQGITFGDTKVQKWITSLFVSFLTSVFLTEPIKVTLITFILVSIFRSSDSGDKKDLNDEDDDIKGLNKYDKNKNDCDESEDDDDEKEYKRINFEEVHLTENEKKELKCKQIKKKRARKLIKDLIFNSVFLFFLFVVAYTNKDINSFNYKNSLEQVFLDDEYQAINDLNELWSWIRSKLTVNLKGDKFISDQQSYLLSFPILRQLRKTNNSCKALDKVKDIVESCTKDYAILTEEKASYGLEWSNDLNYPQGSNLEQSFEYVKPGSLDSFPYFGLFNNYNGGGYIYKMIESDLIKTWNDLNDLKRMSWIDKQTAALFIEFSLYNPNVNLFAYCTILFELLPTGNMIKSARFYPLNLLEENGEIVSMRSACNIIYIILICFLLINEIRLINKQRQEYFKNMWNLIEIIIIAFSWAAFSMYLYRLYATDKILSLFKDRNKTDSSNNFTNYIRLEYLSFCNDTLGMCLAFCACFGTLRFLKLLRYNNKVVVFLKALKKSLKELLGFFIVFLMIFASFFQAFYLLLGDKLLSNSTIVKTMQTCFGILLGKFESNSIIRISPYIGSILFISFNIVMVFVILSLMITILSESLGHIKNTHNDDTYEPDLFEYFYSKFSFIFERNKNNNITEQNKLTYIEYDYGKDFDRQIRRIDKLIGRTGDSQVLQNNSSFISL